MGSKSDVSSIFPAAVSQWLGHKTCWGSAFSHARPKHLFLEFGLVACRLPSLTLRKAEGSAAWAVAPSISNDCMKHHENLLKWHECL